MKKYPQRIVLVDNAETLANFPTQPERVTVLEISLTGHVQKISYWNPASESLAGFLE
jgi:hypothetical protein